MNVGNSNEAYNVLKLKQNEEFGEINQSRNVIRSMLHQTVSLIKNYPRSIVILSIIQFGVYFVCNGMLLFFPDILNETAKSNETEIPLCTIVESAIRDQKLHQQSRNTSICIDELDISSYSYAMQLEMCYVVGFLIISWMVNYTGRLAIFSFIFFTTSFCGFAINYVGLFTGKYFYIWLLACGINNTLLNTVTYDLFPTNLRSLAMSLSLMFGRLGSLVGANIAGYLLEQYCGATFTTSGIVLLVSGILTFFIPNIIKKK